MIPSAASSYSDFCRYVYSIPFISELEEKSLAIKVKESNDRNAVEHLINSHLSLVLSIARPLKGYGIEQMDLIQEGIIGLMKAIKAFDPYKGIRLGYFAKKYIMGEMYEFIVKNANIVKIATTKPLRKLFFGAKSAGDTDNEICDSLNVSAKDLNEYKERTRPTLYLDDVKEDSDNEYLLADTRYEPLNVITRNKDETQVVLESLHTLPERQQYVIRERYLNPSIKTREELGKELGVSQQRVEQIERDAIKKLRGLLCH